MAQSTVLVQNIRPGINGIPPAQVSLLLKRLGIAEDQVEIGNKPWTLHRLKDIILGRHTTVPGDVVDNLMRNQPNDAYVKALAPIFETDARIIRTEHVDQMIIPYLPVAYGGPTLSTSEKKQVHAYKLLRHGAHEVAELRELSDREGDRYWAGRLAVLAMRGLQTLALELGRVLIDTGWENIVKRYRIAGTNHMDHAALRIRENYEFGLANRNLDAFMGLMLSAGDEIDTIILPMGMQRQLGLVLADTQLPLYQADFSADSTIVYSKAIESKRVGTFTAYTYTSPTNKQISVLEAPNIFVDADGEGMVQPFKTRATLGTIEPMQPSINFFLPSSLSDERALVTLVVHQTPDQIELRPLGPVAAIRHCGLFPSSSALDYEDDLKTVPRVSPEQTALVTYYNNANNRAKFTNIVDYYHTRAVDQQEEARPSVNAVRNLHEMTEFRHYDGFVNVETNGEAKGQVFAPRIFGDLSVRTLPTDYIVAAAHKLLRVYAERRNNDGTPVPAAVDFDDIFTYFNLKHTAAGSAYPGREPGVRAQRDARITTIEDKTSSQTIRDIARALCFLHFTAANAERLARLGIPLFRLDYWRPFQQYNTGAAIAMKRDGSVFTAVANPTVTTSFNADQLQFTANSSFEFAVIPTIPGQIHLVPHVWIEGYVSGRGTDYVQDAQQLMIPNGEQRPSVVVMPLPLPEDRYDYPVHKLNESAFSDREYQPSPLRKTSTEHRLRVRNAPWVNRQAALERGPRKYELESALDMTFLAHRGPVSYYESDGRKAPLLPGTGPLGDVTMNASTTDTVLAYRGYSPFKGDTRPVRAVVA